MLSPTGDFVWGGSQANFYVNVPAAPAQAIKTRLLLIQGEWYLDITAGTPWFSTVLGKNSQSTADLTLQDVILGTQGVTTLPSYQSQLDSERNYSAQATANTQYGSLSVTINPNTTPGLALLTQDNIVITTQDGERIII